MPSKNVVKTYIENGYYHIYNRGIEKREIFLDEQDCKVFLHYLKLYLSSVDDLLQMNDPSLRISRFISLNLSKEIDLLSFAVMPNHMHLQIKQYSQNGITKLMQRLLTSYVMYFNRKYQRKGPLFESTYKAALIESEIYLLHLSRYIHLNPSNLKLLNLNYIDFSSYPYYLGQRQASWIKPQDILNYFRSAKKFYLKDILSYQSFVEDYVENAEDVLQDLTLEREN